MNSFSESDGITPKNLLKSIGSPGLKNKILISSDP